jgi:hypothetical protein
MATCRATTPQRSRGTPAAAPHAGRRSNDDRPTSPRVDISDLGIAGELGAGGQGKVRAVSGLLINAEWPAAVKIYSSATAPNVNTAVLERSLGSPSSSATLTEAGSMRAPLGRR